MHTNKTPPAKSDDASSRQLRRLVRRPGRVMHEGRWVCARWYARHVAPLEPTTVRQHKRGKPAPVWALIYLPAVPGDSEDKPETRLVPLNTAREREWAAEMHSGFAQLGGEWATFFPPPNTPAVRA